MGLACARRFAMAGYNVLVLEAESSFGTGVSARSSEVIHAGIYYEEGSLKAKLCIEGREALYRYCESRGVAHRQIGKWIVASDESQLSALVDIRDKAHKNGCVEVDWVEPQNVFVGSRAVIKDRCKIQNNVSVYDNVTLEEGVFCGPSTVFTNVYNPRSLIERKDEYRNTLVKRGATLGANCTIICGVIIGEFAFVGAGAVINKNVKPYALVVGVPGKQIGWMSEFGEQIPLPLNGVGNFVCPHSGKGYQLDGDELVVVDS